jgi:fermentation-respiration switch protein FrsA (DUF1100 family)
LALLALLAAPMASGCGWLNRMLLYHPDPDLRASPQSVGFAFEDLKLASTKDVDIEGWYVPGTDTQPVVLLCHGNGGNMSHRLDKLKLLRQAGAGVMMFDYRGYGRSEGTPTEANTYADGEAAYAWLRAHGVPDSRIVLYGESLGAGVAVELATRHPAASGLVVDSGFTSTLAMGKKIFPHLPVSWLVRYRYDNLSKIPKVKSPLLVLHSPQDDIVPYAMGRALFDAAPQPKTFAEMRGSHNDGFLKSAPEYVAALKAFFATLHGVLDDRAKREDGRDHEEGQQQQERH